jgi:multicomponent Na+:H+ antiporter subunit E
LADREQSGSLNPQTRRGSAADETVFTGSRARFSTFVVTFFFMFLFWIILSGRFDLFHLSLGALSSGLVAYFSGDLLFPPGSIRGLPLIGIRFIAYIPWLLFQIFLASVHVMRLTFHPRMKELIDPHLLTFRSKLKNELALVTFANSITLTPGTITVHLTIDGQFTVHAIDVPSGGSLPGEMEQRIARTFGED